MGKKKDAQATEGTPAPVEAPIPQHTEPAEGPADTQTTPGESTEGEPADGEPADAPGDQPSAAPANEPVGNAAAPLRAPEPDPAPALRLASAPTPAAISAVIGEGHVGIVNAKGEPVDLRTALIRETPSGNTFRCADRVFEETTVPGNDGRTRRRVLFGKDQMVDEYKLRELLAQVDERTAALQGTQPAPAAEDAAEHPAKHPPKKPAKAG